MNNAEIRLKIKKYRLHHYEVAKELGISEYTFCKLLREELSQEKKQLILSAIEKIMRGVPNG